MRPIRVDRREVRLHGGDHRPLHGHRLRLAHLSGGLPDDRSRQAGLEEGFEVEVIFERERLAVQIEHRGEHAPHRGDASRKMAIEQRHHLLDGIGFVAGKLERGAIPKQIGELGLAFLVDRHFSSMKNNDDDLLFLNRLLAATLTPLYLAIEKLIYAIAVLAYSVGRLLCACVASLYRRGDAPRQ